MTSVKMVSWSRRYRFALYANLVKNASEVTSFFVVLRCPKHSTNEVQTMTSFCVLITRNLVSVTAALY